MDSPRKILKKIWGHDHFRAGQEAIIEDLYQNKDVFALLPTGGGKSICYQLPGIAKEGLTIVISPLISLMQDQVEQLTSRGIKAAALYGGLSYREIDILLDNARFGSYRFLYVSPERLETPLFIERFKAMQVVQIVIDEAHCISQWGHDFRPSYARIANLRALKPEVPFSAFTATANEKVKADIIEKLHLKNANRHQTSFKRDNIAYRCFYSNNKKTRVLELCASLKNSSGIVYCKTRRSVREIQAMLNSEGISCAMYHGGMSSIERKKTMDLWMQNQTKVMVATNAFGMGIDKANVRFVIHYEVSDSIEGYFQEAGRGGRDQEKAIGFALFNNQDLSQLKNSIKVKFPEAHKIGKLYSVLFQHYQIAYGDGKDQVVEINIQDFAVQHKMDPLLVYHGLKILELNGDLSLSESVFHPAKVKLMVGISELYNFELQHGSLKDLTQLLIRNYAGIFDLYKRIDLSQLSKSLKKPKQQIVEAFKKLHTFGICDFIAASTEPTITFLRARSQNDTFLLHPSVYGVRKTNYQTQIKSVLDFLESDNCRTQQLLSYFGEQSEKCGSCEYCVKEHSTMEMPHGLIDLLEKPLSIATLMNMTGRTELELIQYLDFLQSEEKVQINDGLITRLTR